MELNTNNFIKADNNIIIHKNAIRWIKKLDECLAICTRSDGCSYKDTSSHKVCKINNQQSYFELLQYFE